MYIYRYLSIYMHAYVQIGIYSAQYIGAHSAHITQMQYVYIYTHSYIYNYVYMCIRLFVHICRCSSMTELLSQKIKRNSSELSGTLYLLPYTTTQSLCDSEKNLCLCTFIVKIWLSTPVLKLSSKKPNSIS